MKRKVMGSEDIRDSQYQSRLQQSWGSIIDHLQSARRAGFVSAYRDDYDQHENERRHALLREDIRSMGYGYTEVKSGCIRNDDGEAALRNAAKAFFIRSVDRQDIMKFGSTYEQKSVLFKDENQFALLYVHYGLMGLTFHSGSNEADGFDPAIIRNALGTLRRTNAQRKSGASTEAIDCDRRANEYFEILALAKPVRSEFYLAQKTKDKPRTSWIRLQEYLHRYQGVKHA